MIFGLDPDRSLYVSNSLNSYRSIPLNEPYSSPPKLSPIELPLRSLGYDSCSPQWYRSFHFLRPPGHSLPTASNTQPHVYICIYIERDIHASINPAQLPFHVSFASPFYCPFPAINPKLPCSCVVSMPFPFICFCV